MPERLALNYENLTIIWLIMLSFLGGLVQYIRKVNAGIIARFSIAELIGELAISGFVGLMSFLLCDLYAVDLRLTAVFIGMTSYMGSRSIFIFEYYLKKKAGIMINEEEITKQDENTLLLNNLSLEDKDKIIKFSNSLKVQEIKEEELS